MILIIKKKNAILMSLILILLAVIYSLNITGVDKHTATSSNGQQRVVILDPGHGGEDPGAVSDYSGLKEKDVNLVIALKVKDLLEKDGYGIIMTRKEDRLEYNSQTKNIVQKRKEDLIRRKSIMDNSGANVVVSIHLNKFPQTQYSGAQAFFPPNSPESQKLAVNIQKSIRETVDPGNKREALLKKEPIIILKDNKTTTAVVECGFLSNAEEEKRLSSPEYQEKLSVAIKNGITNYFTVK